MRVILHVDMDSFFSAVEMREHPLLKGLPVVVGGKITEEESMDIKEIRGVVSTCSYEAREYGIHSAMALSKAYELCPAAKFLPVNMALYKRVSEEIMAILREHADKLEQVSIDEAFLDISTRVNDWHEARDYALMIKNEILTIMDLTCSVGVAPNKTIAKIASDFVKPDGLTVVEEGRVMDFLAPLEVNKIPGVGPKTAEMLKKMGIETIRQLASCDLHALREKLGKYGNKLHMLANGIDEREVEEEREQKSLSRERTFAEDTNEASVLNTCMDELAEGVYHAVTKEGFVFKTVGIKVKFEDFTVLTRAKSMRTCHSDLNTIKRIAKELMMTKVGFRDKRIRLVGVRVSNLTLLDDKQMRLLQSRQTPV
ncbi:MAG: DNA polymerase IV [Halobacteriota archaeon]